MGLFRSSSMVEHSTVNRMVAGSSPASGATILTKYHSYGTFYFMIQRRGVSEAEEMLVEAGLTSKRSVRQRQILACFACRWSQASAAGESEALYGYEVMQCTQIGSGTVYPILARLESAGVVSSQLEDIKPEQEGRPQRRYYEPVNSEVGVAFKSSLTPPQTCWLADIPGHEA